MSLFKKKFFKASKEGNSSHYIIDFENLSGSEHGLRTPNEGINQRNLKIWADVADKICFGST